MDGTSGSHGNRARFEIGYTYLLLCCIDQAKKFKADVSSAMTNNNEISDETTALVAALPKKDRKKYHKAVALGQTFTIVDGKLVRRTQSHELNSLLLCTSYLPNFSNIT
jgi:hypothetical protein